MPLPARTLHPDQIEPSEFFVHPEPLGANLYDKERVKVVPPARSFDAPSTSSAGGVREEAQEKGTSGGGAAMVGMQGVRI